jgi:hypothetical protein
MDGRKTLAKGVGMDVGSPFPFFDLDLTYCLILSYQSDMICAHRSIPDENKVSISDGPTFIEEP